MPGLVDSTRNFGTEPQMTPGLAQGAGPYAKTASLPKLPFSGKKLAETDVCPVSRLTYPCQPLISEQRENKWLTVATVAVCLPTTPSNVVLDPYHHLYVGRESSFEMVGSLIYICNNLCKTVTAVNDEKIAKSSESQKREVAHLPIILQLPTHCSPTIPWGGLTIWGAHTASSRASSEHCRGKPLSLSLALVCKSRHPSCLFARYLFYFAPPFKGKPTQGANTNGRSREGAPGCMSNH